MRGDGEPTGKIASDLDGLLHPYLFRCDDSLGQGRGPTPFDHQFKTGVVGFVQFDRPVPGVRPQRRAFAEVAWVRERDLQHRWSAAVLDGHDQRDLAVGRLAIDPAVPTIAGRCDQRRQTVEPDLSGFPLPVRRHGGQAGRDRDGHGPHLRRVPYADAVSTEIGRSFAIPDDPADRPVRRRRAVRLIVVGPDDRVLLFEDSDPGISGLTWWVTPGGGIDPGETERQTAVREMAEETGYVLSEDSLIGPLATRYAVHGYTDQVLEQHESFYLARVQTFEVDVAGHTVDEQVTLQGHRWWSRDEINAGTAWIWPAELVEIWDRAADSSQPVLELGRQEESTVSV